MHIYFDKKKKTQAFWLYTSPNKFLFVQIKLIQSLNIYNTDRELRNDYSLYIKNVCLFISLKRISL